MLTNQTGQENGRFQKAMRGAAVTVISSLAAFSFTGCSGSPDPVEREHPVRKDEYGDLQRSQRLERARDSMDYKKIREAEKAGPAGKVVGSAARVWKWVSGK